MLTRGQEMPAEAAEGVSTGRRERPTLEKKSILPVSSGHIEEGRLVLGGNEQTTSAAQGLSY
jgi:hypothetical protein